MRSNKIDGEYNGGEAGGEEDDNVFLVGDVTGQEHGKKYILTIC